MGLDDEMSMFCELVKDITSSSHGKPGNTQVNYIVKFSATFPGSSDNLSFSRQLRFRKYNVYLTLFIYSYSMNQIRTFFCKAVY